MKELILLLIIGCCLSIDAFSIATVLGLKNLTLKKSIKTSLTVGIFDFIMPLIGVLISYSLNKIYLKQLL